MSLLGRARAKTKLILMHLGKGVQNIDIPEIPKEWSNFMDTQDEWVEIPYPESENSTACLYKAKKGGRFPPHRHIFSDELFVITNKGGHARIITEKDIFEIKYPQSVLFEAGEIHAIEWLADTDIFIIWHPHFTKGWEAEKIEGEFNN